MSLLQDSTLFLKRHASTILTYAGGAGVIATSVMAVKATPKAFALLENAKTKKGEGLTKLEKIKVAGIEYIPAIIMGVSTIICIFGANALNKRQQAALISAYALLNNSYKDYKKKLAELYGEYAVEEIKKEIAKDKYEKCSYPLEDGKELSDSLQRQSDLMEKNYFMTTFRRDISMQLPSKYCRQNIH